MFTLFRRRPRVAEVVRDAERMIRDLGPGAFLAAGELAWREDAGLIATRRAGHWHDVQIEIGRQTGQPPIVPRLAADHSASRPLYPQ